MESTSATINATREFPHPAASVFVRWISPETRQRWEAGPDTGMTYDAFDTREGGVETVRIAQDGKEVGHMLQNVHRLVRDRLIACSVAGVFGGTLTMLMQAVIEFQTTDEGSRPPPRSSTLLEATFKRSTRPAGPGFSTGWKLTSRNTG